MRQFDKPMGVLGISGNKLALGDAELSYRFVPMRNCWRRIHLENQALPYMTLFCFCRGLRISTPAISTCTICIQRGDSTVHRNAARRSSTPELSSSLSSRAEQTRMSSSTSIEKKRQSLALVGETPILLSRRKLSDEFQFRPPPLLEAPRPPFISEIAQPEDRCPSDGLAWSDGEPQFVTCLGRDGRSLADGGEKKATGECPRDVPSNQVYRARLAMPHRLSGIAWKLYVLTAGRGELADCRSAE